MKCKICNQNETDNTSGICWECMGKHSVVPIKVLTIGYKLKILKLLNWTKGGAVIETRNLLTP